MEESSNSVIGKWPSSRRRSWNFALRLLRSQLICFAEWAVDSQFWRRVSCLICSTLFVDLISSKLGRRCKLIGWNCRLGPALPSSQFSGWWTSVTALKQKTRQVAEEFLLYLSHFVGLKTDLFTIVQWTLKRFQFTIDACRRQAPVIFTGASRVFTEWAASRGHSRSRLQSEAAQQPMVSCFAPKPNCFLFVWEQQPIGCHRQLELEALGSVWMQGWTKASGFLRAASNVTSLKLTKKNEKR